MVPNPLDMMQALNATDESSTPTAKQLSQAVSGKVSAEKEEGPARFKKGPLKGIDKLLFFSMLGDALSTIGGNTSHEGITEQFVRLRQEQQARRDALDEREKDRALRKLEREQDVKAAKDAADVKAKHEVDLAEMRADLQLKNSKKILEMETRAKLIGGINSDLWADTSLLDVNIPEYLTPESTAADPALREELRRIVAPAKRRFILAKIAAQQGTKAAQDEVKNLASFSQMSRAWMNGLRPVSQAEQQATGNFSPMAAITDASGNKVGTVRDQAARDLAMLDPAVLADPELYSRAKETFINDTFEDMLMTNPVFDLLSLESQAEQRQAYFSSVGLLYDSLAQQEVFSREQNAALERELTKEAARVEKIRQKEERKYREASIEERIRTRQTLGKQ